MKPIMFPHVIPQHWSQQDEVWLRQWADACRPFSAKTVWVGVPAHIDSILRLQPEFLIIRDYELADAGQRGVSTVGEAVQRAREHAQAHLAVAERIEREYGYPRSKMVFEGWNEPPIWQDERYKLVDAYETMRMTSVSAWNGRCGVGNINTGHPDNSGPGTDPNWFWFPLMKQVLEQSVGRHMLCLHEYCAFSGPDQPRPNGQGGWTWDMGRYTRNHWNCDIAITEWGVDEAVFQGGHLGWQYIPEDSMDKRAEKYARWALWYAGQVAKDRRVKGVYIFTHDSQSPDWHSFHTNEESFMRFFLPAMAAADFPEPVPQPPPPPPPPPPPAPYPSWLVNVVESLPKHPTLRYEKRTTKVRYIAIHHTAGPVTGEFSTPERIALMHIEDRGWPGIAYHLFIDRKGKTFLTNYLETKSFHVANMNHVAVGLCFVGDMTKVNPTLAQLDAGKRALEWLMGTLWLTPHDVIGHGELQTAYSTECPGGDWWKEMLDMIDHAKVRNISWNVRGIALDLDSAFVKKASELGLGYPLTNSYDFDGLRAQQFDGGILVCKIGQWDQMTLVSHLP